MLIGSTSNLLGNIQTSERDSLRYHLENLRNELRLLIKNQKVDRADLDKQKRDLTMLKVYDRIPLERGLTGLEKDLTHGAKNQGLKLTGFNVILLSKSQQKIPPSLTTNQTSFHLSHDQIVETIYFEFQLKGPASVIQSWVNGWSDSQKRIIELNPGESVAPLVHPHWRVQAHAYRFRPIRFPQLRARIPEKASVKGDPFLLNVIHEIQELSLNSPPLYAIHEQFLLNDARLTFFLSKSVSR